MNKIKSRELVIDLPTDQTGDSLPVKLKLDCGRTYQIFLRSHDKINSVLEHLAYMDKSALVASDGGMISNLTVQENLLLPIRYHAITDDKAALRQATGILLRLIGKEEVEWMLQSRPSLISKFEKKLAGFVRAMLMEPEILIYESVFEDMTASEITTIIKFNEIFHVLFPFRTAIFLDLDHTQGIMPADQTFIL